MLVLILVFVVPFNLSGVISGNDLVCSFNEHPDKSQIEENVISGCTFFLRAKSAFYLLLMEYEKTCNRPNLASDIQLMNEHLEATIASLEVSIDFYIRARDLGQRIGLNQNKLGWFKAYNYNMLVENQKLKPEMSMKVMQYLSKGDILGIYNQNIVNLSDLMVDLTTVRLKLTKNMRPDVTAMWRMLEKFSDAVMFGNYSTRMGKTVLNNCEKDLSGGTE